MQVKGFVLPAPKLSVGDHKKKKKQVKEMEQDNNRIKCPILMITMSSMENEFKFSSELTALPQQCFEKQRATVSYELAERVSKLQLQFSNFFLPVGTAGLVKMFDSGAIRLPSGKSIVVAYEGSVYKLVFSSQLLIQTLHTVSKLWKLNCEHFLSLPSLSLAT